MRRAQGVWGADVPVSMPQPTDDDLVQVDFGGFAFTPSGIAHAISPVDIERVYSPFYAPEGSTAVSGGAS